jgi:intein/homing endonuclease
MENGGTIQDNKKDSDVPDEILVASNDGLDDEEESLDLVGIAHQIKERDKNLARQLKDSD